MIKLCACTQTQQHFIELCSTLSDSETAGVLCTTPLSGASCSYLMLQRYIHTDGTLVAAIHLSDVSKQPPYCLRGAGLGNAFLSVSIHEQ